MQRSSAIRQRRNIDGTDKPLENKINMVNNKIVTITTVTDFGTGLLSFIFRVTEMNMKVYN